MEATLEKKAGFKQTKIGWIPNDWSLIPLGDLFEFKNGVNTDKNSYGSGIPFINVMEVIKNNSLSLADIPGTVTLDEKSIKANLVKQGDVLFNRTSETIEEIGLTSVYLDNEPVVFGGFVIRGRQKTTLVNEVYTRDCFNIDMVRKQIVSKGQGAVRANIGQKDLEKVLLPIPPLSEQIKIGSILSLWDDAISNSQSLIEELKIRKLGLMQHLLTGKERLKGFGGEWTEQKLETYFTERKETGFSDLPLLSVGKEGVYPQDNSAKKDTSNADKSKYKRICVGDIGYNTMRMWQGRSALSQIEGIVSPAYTIVTPKENANSVFFSYLFKLEEIVHKFYRNSQGMVSDTWMCKFKDFSIVKFQVPPTKEEQDAIAKILEKADEEIVEMGLKLDVLQQQKKGLMQQLLTGQKRVKI